MKFELEEARFIEKHNRFLCTIELQGEHHYCHIPNTGRLKELLFLGNTIYVKRFEPSNQRKTEFELSLAIKEGKLYSVDSRMPNALFKEWLNSGFLDKFGTSKAQAEKTYQNSRFDFLLSGDFNGYVEVKGVTLEREGIGYFPDAPSERALKHLKELVSAKRNGFDAAVVFVCQSEMIKQFKPNWETDPSFSAYLNELIKNDVQILAYNCKVDLDGIQFLSEIPVNIED